MNTKPIYDYSEIRFFYKNARQCRGEESLTVAYRIRDDQTIEYAVAICHPDENFVKKTGREIAKDRLIKRTDPYFFTVNIMEIVCFDMLVAQDDMERIFHLTYDEYKSYVEVYDECDPVAKRQMNAAIAYDKIGAGFDVNDLERTALYDYFEGNELSEDIRQELLLEFESMNVTQAPVDK